jgi:hypothetical protein
MRRWFRSFSRRLTSGRSTIRSYLTWTFTPPAFITLHLWLTSRSRSQLPQLETQLAALEAKIKAAEERLAAAQAASSGQGGTQARS